MYRPSSLTILVNCLAQNVESGYVSIQYTCSCQLSVRTPRVSNGKEERTDWHVVILLRIVDYVVLALK
jgi:hypothetical protein